MTKYYDGKIDVNIPEKKKEVAQERRLTPYIYIYIYIIHKENDPYGVVQVLKKGTD